MRDLGQEFLGHCLAKVLTVQDCQVPPLQLSQVVFRASPSVTVSVPHLTLNGPGLTVVLGPNGAGKSLLVRLMHGLIRPDSGAITLGDVPVHLKTTERQAMVFQKPVLLRRSVVANLKFALKFGPTPRRDRYKKLRHLIELAGLEGKERQPARSLSGGEEQCLALACALAREPKVLFLDEPTSSLDPNATDRIETILRQAAFMGVRIVMVSHDMAQAQRLADDVVFISGGQIHEHRPATDFFAEPKTAQAHAFLNGRLVLSG